MSTDDHDGCRTVSCMSINCAGLVLAGVIYEEDCK
jgi:hypothetical protein